VPARNWTLALNELGVTLITTDPTEVAASLVFVVQSPWAGLFVPNASVADRGETALGRDVDVGVDEDVEGIVVVGPLAQPDTKTNVTTTTAAATAMDRRGDAIRMRARS